MRTLFLWAALLVAPVLVQPAFADTPKIHRMGMPEQDRVFGEVSNIFAVLDAAEQRMDELERQVSTPIGLPGGTPLDASVFEIKKLSKGDIRTINAGGRSILLVGQNAPEAAKTAATALNEGTQELAQIAEDIGKLPARLDELKKAAAGLKPTADGVKAAGLESSALGDLENKYTHNHLLTQHTQERANQVSDRATLLLGALAVGMSKPLPAEGASDAATDAGSAAAVVAPDPAPAPKPAGKQVPTVSEVLKKAWSQFDDAEIDAAVDSLAEADMLVVRQTQPVPRSELIELFQLRGLVNIVKGDATAAAWSATQALVIHPNATPAARCGPDYAKLHKALQKAGIVKKVDVKVEGDGRAYLSGIEVTRGATIQLGQGQHLLQVEQKDGTWKGSVVFVRDGFTVTF
ncbi:MAG: hypothetical protein H6737_02075 [Alphaproteobacteria bacterium]|nr:hypothetical protein [Alphaproteobacteria bacterium]